MRRLSDRILSHKVQTKKVLPVPACLSVKMSRLRLLTIAVLPSPRPWDFPPSIDGDISRADDLMELDDPEGMVSLD
jgi:hypothetical protein